MRVRLQFFSFGKNPLDNFFVIFFHNVIKTNFMRPIFILLFFSSLGCNSLNSGGQKKLPRYGYYGKIKTSKETTFRDSLINGKYVWDYKRPGLIQNFQFDEKGNRIEDDVEFDDNGNALSKTIHHVDANGNNLSEETHQDGQIYKPFECTYDSKNRMTSQSNYMGTEIQSRTIYNYNESGSQMTELNYDNSDTIPNETNLHYYDKAGQDTFTVYNSRYGKTEWRTTYDAKGNRIKLEVSEGEPGTVTETNYYKYDEAGNRLEHSENSEHTGGKTIITEKVTYDLNGNEIEKLEFDYTGKLTKTMKYEYTYDSQGNWITRTIFCDGDQTGYEERTIEYY
jgi:hypothetical protein